MRRLGWENNSKPPPISLVDVATQAKAGRGRGVTLTFSRYIGSAPESTINTPTHKKIKINKTNKTNKYKIDI